MSTLSDDEKRERIERKRPKRKMIIEKVDKPQFDPSKYISLTKKKWKSILYRVFFKFLENFWSEIVEYILGFINEDRYHRCSMALLIAAIMRVILSELGNVLMPLVYAKFMIHDMFVQMMFFFVLFPLGRLTDFYRRIQDATKWLINMNKSY